MKNSAAQISHHTVSNSRIKSTFLCFINSKSQYNFNLNKPFISYKVNKGLWHNIEDKIFLFSSTNKTKENRTIKALLCEKNLISIQHDHTVN